MGLLRFLLALSVVIDHSHSNFLGIHSIGGRLAVQSFFIISGFYMALILSTKYSGEKKYWLFLSNRLMRIYPLYWVMLLVIVVSSVVTLIITGEGGRLGFYVQNFTFYSLPSYLYVIFTNIFILGLDSLYYLGINSATGHFYFTANWSSNSPKVSNMIFNEPAWTISLELIFYFLAPFLNKLKLVPLVLIAALSIGIKVFIINTGLTTFPWGHAFFPAEFFLFLSGIFAYRIYDQFLNNITVNNFIQFAILGFVLLLTLLFSFVERFIPFLNWIYLFIFFISVPFIFKFSKHNRLDSNIGEYSYPIYVVHIFLIFVLRKMFDKLHIPEVLFTPSVILIVISFSYFLIRFVSSPIEKLRQARVKRFIATR